jgi:hypothetical protein
VDHVGTDRRIRRAVPDVASDRFDESRQFYGDVLGFEVVMDLGSVVTLASPANPTALTEVRRVPHVPQHQDAS